MKVVKLQDLPVPSSNGQQQPAQVGLGFNLLGDAFVS